MTPTLVYLMKHLSFSKHLVYLLKKPYDTGVTNLTLQRSTLRRRKVVWTVAKPQWGMPAPGLTHSFSCKSVLHHSAIGRLFWNLCFIYLLRMLNEGIIFVACFFLKRIWNAFTKKKTVMSLKNQKRKKTKPRKRGEWRWGNRVGTRFARAGFLAGRARVQGGWQRFHERKRK